MILNIWGLPTLHEVLQSVFLYTSSGLLTIGAIFSAVFRKNDTYMFFDSHFHGENELSSNDGKYKLKLRSFKSRGHISGKGGEPYRGFDY